jgi:hypothetical protein
MLKFSFAPALLASVCVLVPALVSAQPKAPGGKAPTPPAASQGGSAPNKPTPAPTSGPVSPTASARPFAHDLITEVEFTKQCALRALVKNDGLGPIPDVYGGEFSLHVNVGEGPQADRRGAPVQFDDVRAPGASRSLDPIPNVLGPTRVSVSTIGDQKMFGPVGAQDFAARLSPTGRGWFDKVVTCPHTPPRFDLVLEDVRLDASCVPQVTIRNAGPETLPAQRLSLSSFAGERRVPGMSVFPNDLPKGGTLQVAVSLPQGGDQQGAVKRVSQAYTFQIEPTWGLDVDAKSNSKTVWLSCPTAPN